jgi:hypothetical protein
VGRNGEDIEQTRSQVEDWFGTRNLVSKKVKPAYPGGAFDG